MAEGAVSFAAAKIYNLLKEEVNFLVGVHDQVRLLESELRQMQAFLKFAGSKVIEDDNISNFLGEVSEVAYDAVNIIEKYILRMHRRRQGRTFKGFIKKYGCIHHECRQRHNIRMHIEKVKIRLQNLSAMKSRYGISDVPSVTQGTVSHVDMMVQEQRALAIQRDINATVGFEDVMEGIVRTLLNICEKPRRSVVSIVGMGGAGKSTLARRVCNRSDVWMNFNGCALVTVSQTPNLRKILEDIVIKFSYIDRKTIKQMEEGDLKDMVLTSLKGKRYLIVLDDIWGTDVWPMMCPHFPDEKNGSRVIITTRSMDVAQHADPSTKPYQLRPLSEEESWDLFTKVVDDGDAEKALASEDLKMVGKKILKKCGGLPLAIRLIGGMLSIKDKSPIAWEDVVKEIRWEEDPRGRAFSEVVVGLSYRDLPHHLKPCFLYLSHFREDHIQADELIRLWTAEGFVPDRIDGHHKTMEERAQGWLEDLVRRCLVQVVDRDYSGMLVTCQMHDVVRDLSMKEAEKVNFFHTWQQQQVASGSSSWAQTRRLALHGVSDQRNSRYKFQHFSADAPKLCTLVGAVDIEEEEGTSRSLQSFIMRLKLLRVLNLKGSNCRELPKEIGDLIHLRYLGLRRCLNLVSIPSSVSNLRSLQTFDVSCTINLKVPRSAFGIKTLRHVFVEDGTCTLRLLVNLQTLVAHAGRWMESLPTLTNLRHLQIIQILEAHQRVLSDTLDSLLHLRYLSLSAENDGRGVLPGKALALPNHCWLQHVELNGSLNLSVNDHSRRRLRCPIIARFGNRCCSEDKLWVDDHSNNHPTADGRHEMPPRLNKLVLKGSGLKQDPFLMLEKLPYLRNLILSHNAYVGTGRGGAVCCSSGGFPQLEELRLLNESGLRQWTVEREALPRLRRLEISSCPELEMLPDGLQHLTTLQTLEIRNMPTVFVWRLRKDYRGADWHKIQHIPHRKIFE